MTRRQFSPLVVETRLAHIRQFLDDLEALGGFDQERLERERISRLALERRILSTWPSRPEPLRPRLLHGSSRP